MNEILHRAEQQKLYEDPYWHTLLHYRRTLLGRKSLVDDPKFFLSEKGKRDPRAELNATLSALFRRAEDEKKHPICRFVARYDWLIKKLKIDESRLPNKRCTAFNDLVKSMRPESATLIFPTFHINNPASMFGHTLLCIDTAAKSKLLSYAINYTAVTGPHRGPFYVLKGTFGGYKGYFSILSYYAKLAQYSDFDHRDIWEYQLTLSREEVIRVMMHLVEMDNVYSYYYFFDENCSYNLLFLLDVARPTLRLSESLGWWEIPVDTIRAAQKSSIITGVNYRPSRVTKIRYMASLLSSRQQKMSRSLAKGTATDLDKAKINNADEETPVVLDLATEYLKYLYYRGNMKRKDFQKRLLSILKMRSSLGTREDVQYSIPVPVDPLQGHRSARFQISTGFDDMELYQEIALRPSYHSLIDPDDGYIEGGQIVFTDLAFRYYYEQKKFKFERLDIVDIESLTPRDRFIKSISWKIKTGFYRMGVNNGDEALVYAVNPGGGLAWKPLKPFLFYILAEPDGELGPDLDQFYQAGLGGSSGLMVKVCPSWKMHFIGRDIYYMLGNRYNSLQVSVEQMVRLSTNNVLVLRALRHYTNDNFEDSISLGWNVFF